MLLKTFSCRSISGWIKRYKTLIYLTQIKQRQSTNHWERQWQFYITIFRPLISLIVFRRLKNKINRTCEQLRHCRWQARDSSRKWWGRRNRRSNNLVKKPGSIWLRMVAPSKGPRLGLQVKTGQPSWRLVEKTLNDNHASSEALRCQSLRSAHNAARGDFITGRNQNSLGVRTGFNSTYNKVQFT